MGFYKANQFLMEKKVKGKNKTSMQYESGSFRDREARVIIYNDQVFRLLGNKATNNWKELQNTKFFQKFLANHNIIPANEVKSKTLQKALLKEDWKTLLLHPTIPFISYPYQKILMKKCRRKNFLKKEFGFFHLKKGRLMTPTHFWYFENRFSTLHLSDPAD